jgi:hypothetical protein
MRKWHWQDSAYSVFEFRNGLFSDVGPEKFGFHWAPPEQDPELR